MPHKHEQGSPSQSHLSHIQLNPASHKASAHWSFQCHTKDPKCDDYVRIQRRPKLKAVGLLGEAKPRGSYRTSAKIWNPTECIVWNHHELLVFCMNYLFVSVRSVLVLGHISVQILWKIGSLLGPQLQVSNNLSSAAFLYSKHDPKRCE